MRHRTGRRYPNGVLLSAFAALVVMYFVVAAATTGRPVNVPELALDWAVPLQTLFIKQHYLADVIAGALLALAAHAICMRPRASSIGWSSGTLT